MAVFDDRSRLNYDSLGSVLTEDGVLNSKSPGEGAANLLNVTLVLLHVL